ncbi:hypothetical protein BH11MYX1_BH11MYX1_51230 [soil metagenome]
MRFVLCVVLAVAACHGEPAPHHPAEGEVPPLPPASGTPVGYLLDASTELKLRPEQLEKLQKIDTALVAENSDLDVQLRQIEKPEPEEQISPQEAKAGRKAERHNMAPGSSVAGNANSVRLHQIRNNNDKEALTEAWKLLDPDQQSAAKKVLEDRGLEVPGPPKGPKGPDEAGQPIPGMEP